VLFVSLEHSDRLWNEVERRCLSFARWHGRARFMRAREGHRLAKDRSELILDRQIAECAVHRSATGDAILIGFLAAIGERIKVLDTSLTRGDGFATEKALMALLN
jgi:hypothetical protein